jgi:hypothetical protein
MWRTVQEPIQNERSAPQVLAVHSQQSPRVLGLDHVGQLSSTSRTKSIHARESANDNIEQRGR